MTLLMEYKYDILVIANINPLTNSAQFTFWSIGLSNNLFISFNEIEHKYKEPIDIVDKDIIFLYDIKK